MRRPVQFYRVDELVSAYSDDLSDRGVFVRTDAWLPINGVVDLCVVLPDQARVVVPARVAYCLPPEQAEPLGRRAGIGFEFVDATHTSLGRLRGYLERLGPDRERARANVAQRRVLIACAHPRLQKRLVHALSTGPALGVVDTPGRLVQALAQSSWDVLLLDDSTVNANALPGLLRAAGSSLPPLLYVCPSHDEIVRLHAYRAGVTECLPRPFTDEELRLRLRQLAVLRQRKLTPDLAGSLSRMPAATVLGLLAQERRSGVLTLQCDAGRVSISLNEGEVSAVDGGELTARARARVLDTLLWDQGYCEFHSSSSAVSVAGAWSVAGLLLEAARWEDEVAERVRAAALKRTQ